MNPFTAVKDKFFATYLSEDDLKSDNDHDYDYNTQLINQNRMNNSNSNSNSNSQHNSTSLPSRSPSPHLNNHSNSSHSHSSHSSTSSHTSYSSRSYNGKPPTSSYKTHSKPYHSKKSQLRDAQNGIGIKSKSKPKSTRPPIHSRSYQYKKKIKKTRKSRTMNNGGHNGHNGSKFRSNGNGDTKENGDGITISIGIGINENNPQYQAKKTAMQQRADVIADYLEKVPLLARLSREDRYNLGKAFKQKIYSKNQIVIKQNEPGNEFFIITKGDASVIITSKPQSLATEDKSNEEDHGKKAVIRDIVATLHPGDYFGETALLTSKPRNATVKSNETQLHCLVLDKETFINVFGKERVRVNFGKRGVTYYTYYIL